MTTHTHHKKSHKKNQVKELFNEDRESVGFFFLGVGLTMFLLNITTILNLIQYYNTPYPMVGFYVSVLSSIFLMAYSLLNIYTE